MGTITSPSAARSRRVASLGGYGGPSDVTTALKIIGDHVGGLAMKVAMRLLGEDWITSLMRSRGQRIGCQMISPLLRAATWLYEVDQRISSSIGSHFMRAATRLFGEERIASLMRSYASCYIVRSLGRNFNPWLQCDAAGGREGDHSFRWRS
ncbi:hypothetical protein DEU56DRAFT_797431 [Suillus clintonianus]|uniref:uncharacterized protein n=1 Tax=Suillus clintonianus TaxID=1904413 RepID=UPI001B8757BC|nr:uncharacterized protein DEU56DRAFT_843457 [Suillus clintonianus]XP_041201296.1 uncharacterized protein DEU56DRAFT_842433 [Suillus clintonianus]XP_041209764.1 uncharacterized protein DEU56DRAFT_797431 [Suillus clintonianus]KAG2111747.1 hypothetical protein DEU56DRAFT_843457 [Suillus clintonianus]KAG2113239.1 hypothetical protein DEU56DRAFT_842433 [Suillus clintonianus]KAG2141118.1 hypothetical protein DEU56DRAFT_797431 [Suillus clintonianus]